MVKLNSKKIEKVLDKIKYPNSKIHFIAAWESDPIRKWEPAKSYNRICLHSARADSEDSSDLADCRATVELHTDGEEEVIQTAYLCVVQLELHELSEVFTFDGIAVRNPHTTDKAFNAIG